MFLVRTFLALFFIAVVSGSAFAATDSKSVLYYYGFELGGVVQLFFVPEDDGGETTILVNTGSQDNAAKTVETLKNLGIKNIDLLILTDSAENNTGGLTAISDNFKIHSVADSGFSYDTKALIKFKKSADERGVLFFQPNIGDKYKTKYAELEFLTNEKANGMAFTITIGEIRILVSSILLKDLEKHIGYLPVSEVVVVQETEIDVNDTSIWEELRPEIIIVLNDSNYLKEIYCGNKTVYIRGFHDGQIGLMTDGVTYYPLD